MPKIYCRIFHRVDRDETITGTFPNKNLVHIGSAPEADICLDDIPSLSVIVDQTGERPVVCKVSPDIALTINKTSKVERLVCEESTTIFYLGMKKIALTVEEHTEPYVEQLPAKPEKARSLSRKRFSKAHAGGKREFVGFHADSTWFEFAFWDLNGFDLSYAKISVGMRALTSVGTCWYGAALGIMEGCDLRGADLRRVQLSNAGGCNFNGADLRDAVTSGQTKFVKCDFKHALMAGFYGDGSSFEASDLRWANLTGARLNKARLKGAKLSFAQLGGAQLEQANLQGAMLGLADLREAKLVAAELRGARLHGADLRGADLTCARLQDTDLSGANLEGANLEQVLYNAATRWPENFSIADKNLNFVRSVDAKQGSKFPNGHVDLVGVHMQNVDFSRLMLAGACFDGADLSGSSFAKSVLTGASFRDAVLRNVDFAYANLTDADLSGAEIAMTDMQAVGLETVRFVGAKGFELSVWPMSYDHFDFSTLSEPPSLGVAELHTPEDTAADKRPQSVPRAAADHPEPLAEPLRFKLYPDTPDDDSLGLRIWRAMSDSDVLGVLHLSEHTLRLTDKEDNETTRLSWDRTFVVNVAVWLLSDTLLELTVTLRHRGKTAQDPIQLKTVLPQKCVSAHVPRQHVKAPYIAFAEFVQVWSWLDFYSQLHGRGLQGSIALQEL